MEPPPPPPEVEPDRDPKLGLGVALGLAVGGDDIAVAEYVDGGDAALAAGNGVVLSLGIMATPLWVDGKVGLGLGADAGWKYASLSAENGTLSLNRFPFVGSAHVLFEVSSRWYLIASGGVHYEAGVEVAGDGIFEGIQGSLDSSVGAMGEVGAFYSKRELGADVTLRYTAVTYEISGESIDASSIGLFGALHYNLL